jgi:Cu+-exporting ATPase
MMAKAIQLKIEGMSCTSCALRVEKALKKVAFVSDATVSFAGRKALVTLAEEGPLQELSRAVKDAGYAVVEKPQDRTEEQYLKRERIRLITAWVITLPLTIKMLLHMIWGIHIVAPPLSPYIDLALCLPVIFVIGFPVIKSTVLSFRQLSFTMDALIGIGTMAAYSTGVIGLLGVDIASFTVVGAMIMSINLIGNYLKSMATGRASRAIRELMELGAKSARLLAEDGSEREVAVEELKPGDRVLVRPGDKIPLDGRIVQGQTSIDESIISGESIPVDKTAGDSVIGASINQMGTITVQIEKVGSESFLAQIIEMVEQAQSSRVPVQDLADRITKVFVPVIILLSLTTFALWLLFPEIGRSILQAFDAVLPWLDVGMTPVSQALSAAIAVLVIACPCALGLATPTALMVGMGLGAAKGILVRRGEAIEMSRSLDTVVFDKTGTLTYGRAELTDVMALLDERELLKILSSVERKSEHPLAKVMVDYAAERGVDPVEVESFEAIPGRGLRAELGGKQILIGNERFLSERGILETGFEKELETLRSNGKTVILVASGGSVVGLVALADAVKKDAMSTIAELHELGLTTTMLTGDNRQSAASIAVVAGIDRVFAELLPGDKIEKIKELQRRGEKVAMVGDGINDAPALKQADVGIAIGTGTDIAIESADVTLISDSLKGITNTIKLSRATFNRIKANLFWAFFYNVIAIPLAVMGLLHPVIAEIAMATSSITVVTSSLLLKRVLDRGLR